MLKLMCPMRPISFYTLEGLRLTKGPELCDGYNILCETQELVYLVIVGPDDEGILDNLKSRIHPDYKERVRFFDYTEHPERYMVAADVFCLPS